MVSDCRAAIAWFPGTMNLGVVQGIKMGFAPAKMSGWLRLEGVGSGLHRSGRYRFAGLLNVEPIVGHNDGDSGRAILLAAAVSGKLADVRAPRRGYHRMIELRPIGGAGEVGNAGALLMGLINLSLLSRLTLSLFHPLHEKLRNAKARGRSISGCKLHKCYLRCFQTFVAQWDRDQRACE